MSSTVKSLRAKLASCCFSCYLVPPSSTSTSKKSPPPPPFSLQTPSTTTKAALPMSPVEESCQYSPPPRSHSPSRIYQCPQCQTSLQSMGHYWQQMDNERDLWVLPQHLKDFKVKVRICVHYIAVSCK